MELPDKIIEKSPNDLFYGVVTNFKSKLSLFSFIVTNELHLKDDLHGIWETD